MIKQDKDKKEFEKLVNKRFWTLDQWKNGNDIERLVWFISTLSPHNLWRGQEAIDHAIQSAIKEREKEINKKINDKYPPNQFTDSHTGVMTFGVQEPTYIRRPTTEEIGFKNFLDGLFKKEE